VEGEEGDDEAPACDDGPGEEEGPLRLETVISQVRPPRGEQAIPSLE
jgi:hypothetical protein